MSSVYTNISSSIDHEAAWSIDDTADEKPKMVNNICQQYMCLPNKFECY